MKKRILLSKEKLLAYFKEANYKNREGYYYKNVEEDCNTPLDNTISFTSPMFNYCGKEIKISKLGTGVYDFSSDVDFGGGYSYIEEWFEPEIIKVQVKSEDALVYAFEKERYNKSTIYNGNFDEVSYSLHDVEFSFLMFQYCRMELSVETLPSSNKYTYYDSINDLFWMGEWVNIVEEDILNEKEVLEEETPLEKNEFILVAVNSQFYDGFIGVWKYSSLEDVLYHLEDYQFEVEEISEHFSLFDGKGSKLLFTDLFGMGLRLL